MHTKRFICPEIVNLHYEILETHTEKERHRERETVCERERKGERQKERERQSDKERKRQIDRERYRERGGKRVIQTTDRERQRET